MGYSDEGAAYLDLVCNRVGIINQVHGCVYKDAPGNPCCLRHSGNSYVCAYLGDDVVSFSVLDVGSVRRAFAVVDAIANALWLLRRAGMLSVDVV